ncbi:hypothetical protein Tco_1370072 [Tanacetum coccineum]
MLLTMIRRVDILILEALIKSHELKSRLATSFRIRIFGRRQQVAVIIAKDLKDEEKAALIKVLKSHKRAIAWKLSDIKGVDQCFIPIDQRIKRRQTLLAQTEVRLSSNAFWANAKHPATFNDVDGNLP